MDNAVKYSYEDADIKIYAEQTEKESIVCIEDAGVGIIPEDIDRIFDKNFTGTNGRMYYTSTGIGMYLSQKLAQKLGHNISVSSVYGSGTKISVHFPKWNNYFERTDI